jgi:nitroreductase
MKQNFAAWDVKIDDFFKLKNQGEKLRFLLNFAVLAPLSHNSQPWSFRVDGNTIKIYTDMVRSLPASDSNNRQLLISLGCALENILTAADY